MKHRISILSGLAAAVLMIAGCVSTSQGEPTVQNGPQTTPGSGSPTGSQPATGSSAAPAGSLLATALAQVGPGADTAKPYFEFGDTKTLTSLYAKDKSWIGLLAAGAGSLGNYAHVSKDVIGIDPLAADWAVTVNQPPASLTLLRGGQDAALISERATKGGWTGTDVLSTPLNLKSEDYGQYTLLAPRIRPMGTDVAYGGISAAPEKVDVTATGADPGWSDALGCLGEVVAATGAGALPGFENPVAVGVRADGGAATGVICLVQKSEQAARDKVAAVEKDLADGTPAASGQRWSQLLPDTRVDTVGPVVRITSTGTAVTAARVFSMLSQADLPGRG